MRALDDFVTRAQSQNAQHHDNHTHSLQSLSSTVKSSYSNIGTHFTSTYERVRDMGEEMSAQTSHLQEALSPLDENLRQPLAELRSNIGRTALQEYKPTGETPQKMQYVYPTELPRTDAYDTLLASLRRPASNYNSQSPSKSTTMVPVIFNDEPTSATHQFPALHSTRSTPEVDQRPTTSGGLREIDANISTFSAPAASNDEGALPQIPSFKRSVRLEGSCLC